MWVIKCWWLTMPQGDPQVMSYVANSPVPEILGHFGMIFFRPTTKRGRFNAWGVLVLDGVGPVDILTTWQESEKIRTWTMKMHSQTGKSCLQWLQSNQTRNKQLNKKKLFRFVPASILFGLSSQPYPKTSISCVQMLQLHLKASNDLGSTNKQKRRSFHSPMFTWSGRNIWNCAQFNPARFHITIIKDE